MRIPLIAFLATISLSATSPSIAGPVNTLAVDVPLAARLQRLIRTFNSASQTNPRTAGNYTGPITITDDLATLPSATPNGSTQNVSSRGIYHMIGGIILSSGGPKAALINSSGGIGTTYNRTDFNFYGQLLTLRLQGVTSPYRVLVNGRYIPTSNAFNNIYTSQTTGTAYITLDFGSRISARITVEGMQTAALVGAYTEVFGRTWAVDLSDRPNGAMLGDSYVQGTGPGNYADGIVPQLSDLLGVPLLASGSGGTGWNQTSTSAYRFDQRIINGDLSLTYYNFPDLIFMMCSVNDAYSSQNYATVQANALSGFRAARAQYPSTPIIVVGCAGVTGKLTSDITSSENAVSAAVTQEQTGDGTHATDPLIAFIPVTTDPAGAWFTGVASQIVFTAPLAADTTATLATAWANSTATYTIVFSDGSTRTATLTQGSAAVSWTGAVTATATAGAYNGTNGTNLWALSPDWIHLTYDGANYWAQRVAIGTRAAVRTMYQQMLGTPVPIG